MDKLDRIISVLYLAKSDNREKMLSDLIQNVLYSINEPISCDTISEFISTNFHLEPIKYEVQECLDALIDENEISKVNDKYLLVDGVHARIHATVLKGHGETRKRFETFSQIVKDLFGDSVDESEIKNLWGIFNEYLMECFMVFGRKAIDIFLPYKKDHLAGDDDITKQAYDKLKNEKLISVFKKLVIEYPERLTEAELRYLSGLATRAERFYSLGVEREEYEKIKNLQIKDLVVLVDTNVLYSILNLRVHPENAAILELIRIAKQKQVDLRIVYLPRTYSELQKARSYFDAIILKENFKPSQIKALLALDKLDSFARKYYENKLLNSDLPHPSEKVMYAGDFFKSEGVIIYNTRFSELEDNDEYLDKKIVEYMDFQNYYNNLSRERGYEQHLHKDDKKIEHDVFLRESVKILKNKYSEEHELRFVCLTLDRSLIHFDLYSLKRESKGLHKVINPNFLLPSIFIKKIRPFIPISTNDYRKAFITSLTAPNLEKEDDSGTIRIQKTMTYFKNLGIEDEEVIINCVKREMFLEELVKHEKDNTSEEFIKSEITKEIERVKLEKIKLEKVLQEKEHEKDFIIQTKEAEKDKIKRDKDFKLEKLESKVSDKDELIDLLKSTIQVIEDERNRDREIQKSEQNKADYEKYLSERSAQREKFISDNWNSEIPKLRRNTWYCTFVFLMTLLPIVIGFILKANNSFIQSIEEFGVSQWYIWGFLTLVFFIELFGRAYIFNKEKVKNGWEWILALFSKKMYKEIMAFKKSGYLQQYLKINGEDISFDKFKESRNE